MAARGFLRDSLGTVAKDETLTSDVTPTIYEVDGEDRVVRVGGAWDDFAGANDAPHLTESAVRGRKLESFMAEPTTIRIYGILMERVRRGEPVRVPFRCDGPAAIREMELALLPLPADGVRFEATLLGERPRSPVALFDVRLPRSGEFVRMCAWCRRVAVGERWVEAEEATRELRLFLSPRPPLISHGICAPCLEIALKGS